MISPAEIATADDGKRLVLYPLEVSLRDMFAMAALQGLLAGDTIPRNADGSVMSQPAYAYLLADVMIRERAK